MMYNRTEVIKNKLFKIVLIPKILCRTHLHSLEYKIRDFIIEERIRGFSGIASELQLIFDVVDSCNLKFLRIQSMALF
jgi:hypothetical protein